MCYKLDSIPLLIGNYLTINSLHLHNLISVFMTTIYLTTSHYLDR